MKNTCEKCGLEYTSIKNRNSEKPSCGCNEFLPSDKDKHTESLANEDIQSEYSELLGRHPTKKNHHYDD